MSKVKKTYVCSECGSACKIDVEYDDENSSNISPTICPFDGEGDAIWERFEE